MPITTQNDVAHQSWLRAASSNAIAKNKTNTAKPFPSLMFFIVFKLVNPGRFKYDADQVGRFSKGYFSQ
jgi:hypothetical protein